MIITRISYTIQLLQTNQHGIIRATLSFAWRAYNGRYNTLYDIVYMYLQIYLININLYKYVF